jgi:hypothetical protein
MGISSAVGPNVADGDPDETPCRLGSRLPAAKSADRVLNSCDAGSELRAPAAGATKGSSFPVAEAEGAAASKALIGEQPGSDHELSGQAEGLTGDDRGNGPIEVGPVSVDGRFVSLQSTSWSWRPACRLRRLSVSGIPGPNATAPDYTNPRCS